MHQTIIVISHGTQILNVVSVVDRIMDDAEVIDYLGNLEHPLQETNAEFWVDGASERDWVPVRRYRLVGGQWVRGNNLAHLDYFEANLSLKT